MTTVFEGILEHGFATIGDVDRPLFQRLINLLPLAEARFRADNVSEYFFAGTDQEVWHRTDFPNVAPPFTNFWIEMRRPSHIWSCVHGTTAWDVGYRPTAWGVFFHAFEYSATGIMAEITRHQQTLVYPQQAMAFSSWQHDVRWGLTAVLVWEYRPGVYMPVIMKSYPVLPNGAIACVPDDEDLGDRLLPLPLPRDETWRGPPTNSIPSVILCDPMGLPEELHASAAAYIDAALLAICFMHCRNVATLPVTRPRHERRQAEKRQQKLYDFHQLDIKPLQSVMRHAGANRATKGSHQQALHVVRGHFKNFGAAFGTKPLFGKREGTYFWHDTLRGNPERGVREKDYNVALEP